MDNNFELARSQGTIIQPDQHESQLSNQVLDQVIPKIPDVLDSILTIAQNTAETTNKIREIEAEGQRVILDTIAYIRKHEEGRKSLEQRGDFVLKVLRQVHTMLADTSMPEEARNQMAAQLPQWINPIISAAVGDQTAK